MIMKPWTNFDIRVLKRLWKDHSAREIGDRLERPRNSILGKAHRLKLESKVHKRGHKEGLKEARKRSPAITKEYWTKERRKKHSESVRKTMVHTKKFKTVFTTAYGEPLNEPENGLCRWPIGDPQSKDFCYCGGKIKEGRLHKTGRPHIYCEEHYKCSVRVNQKTTKKTNYLDWKSRGRSN